MTDTKLINEMAGRYGVGGDPNVLKMMQVAINAERERCAKIVEGEVYETRYRKWPQISTIGNRAEDSEVAKHCRALAAVIRNSK